MPSLSAGASYIVLIDSGNTSLFPAMPSKHLGGSVSRRQYFTVGFEPPGAETSRFSGPAGFAFESIRRAMEATQRRVQKEKNRGAVSLLKSWLKADEKDNAEHRETLAYLMRVLDEDRPAYRKLFP